MKYPNTKNVLMILVAIILVGAAFVFAEYRNRNTKNIYEKPDISLDKSTDTSYFEDNTDWKKILLANDSSSSTVKDLTKKTEKLTPTDILARDFFARYMEMRQTGIAGDKVSQQEIISQVLKNGMVLSSPKTFSSSDLIINSDNTLSAIKEYGNNSGNIFKKYAINARNEAVIAKDAMDKNDTKILDELDPIIKSYKSMLSGLVKINPPETMASLHLDLLNTLNSLIFVAENFKKSMIDPLAGVQAISVYLPSIERYVNTINGIKNKFISLGINYIPSDGGSFFMPK